MNIYKDIRMSVSSYVFFFLLYVLTLSSADKIVEHVCDLNEYDHSGCTINAGPLEVVTVTCPKTLYTEEKYITGDIASYYPQYCFFDVYTSFYDAILENAKKEKKLSILLPGAIAVHGGRWRGTTQLITPYYVPNDTSIFCACDVSAPHRSMRVVRVNVQNNLRKLKGCDFGLMTSGRRKSVESFLTKRVTGKSKTERICFIEMEVGETVGIMCAPPGAKKENWYRYTYEPATCFEELYIEGIHADITGLAEGITVYPPSFPNNRVYYESLLPRYITIPNDSQTGIHFSCHCRHHVHRNGRKVRSTYGTMMVYIKDPVKPIGDDSETANPSDDSFPETAQPTV